jgi:hypothetical protein
VTPVLLLRSNSVKPYVKLHARVNHTRHNTQMFERHFMPPIHHVSNRPNQKPQPPHGLACTLGAWACGTSDMIRSVLYAHA